MCSRLGVSRAGFYAWRRRPPSRRDRADTELVGVIRAIHSRSRGIYGAPRVHAELAMDFGIRCGRKRVARLMRAAGLVGVHRRRRQGLTVRDPAAVPAPDLVNRRFTSPGRDRLWVADITQHRTWEGWLYLAVVVDAHSRRVVGWAMDQHARTDLVVGALQMAVFTRGPAPGVVHHSDQGAQYTSLAFGRALRAAGINGSKCPERRLRSPQDCRSCRWRTCVGPARSAVQRHGGGRCGGPAGLYSAAVRVAVRCR